MTDEAAKPDRIAVRNRLLPPLVSQLVGYRPAWLKSDLAAGLSVAAVSLPSAIAYPAIAGLPIETGLFATIFSLVGYALFGPSRQVMVGPDTATCIMLAGVLAAAGVGQTDRVALTLALTVAPGITSPFGSVTVPVSVAFAACWPNAAVDSASNNSKTVNTDLMGDSFRVRGRRMILD